MTAKLDTVVPAEHHHASISDQFNRNVYTTTHTRTRATMPHALDRNSGYEPDNEDNDQEVPSTNPEIAICGANIKSVQPTLDYIAKFQPPLPQTSTLHTAAKSRLRSKSQSGIEPERKAYPDHRTRSSSSNRALKSRTARQPDETSVDLVSLRSDRDKLVDELLQRREILKKAQRSDIVFPGNDENVVRLKQQIRSRHERSNSEGSNYRQSRQHQVSLHSPLERTLGLSSKVLSPVSETFGSERTSTGQTHIRKEIDTSSNVQSNSIATNSSRSKMLTFKDGEQFINPLAAHSTSTSRRRPTPPSVEENHGSKCQSSSPSALVNKPLPAPPVSTRQTPIECNAIPKFTGKNGPGLEATSIMRPSSRLNQDHMQSERLPGNIPTTVTYPRKGSYPEDFNESSSAGSGFTSDQSKDSPDRYQPRRLSLERNCSNTKKGGIYNEIRDDLAVVARDLNKMNIEMQSRDRAAKLTKFRIRTRSSSRHDRRSSRERYPENYSSSYIYRELDKSELNGAWGNTVITPGGFVVDDHNILKGEGEIITIGVDAVPEYEELWG